MDVFIYNSPLIGSQAIGFEEYEQQRRKTLPGSSESRTIFLWLVGDKVTSKDSSKGLESINPSIRVSLSQNKFRINELPESWQTPSHIIYVNSDCGHMPHGLEPIIETVVRLEDQRVNCLVSNGGSTSSIVPNSISYASPDIVATIKQRGFNLKEDHTWQISFTQFEQQLNYAYTFRKVLHNKYKIHSLGQGALNPHHLPPVML